jgi:hypothetical protein
VLLRNAPASDSHVIESKPGIGYKIGADHPAGTWETAGADGEQQCEWARKADLTDAPSSVIDAGGGEGGRVFRQRRLPALALRGLTLRDPHSRRPIEARCTEF